VRIKRTAATVVAGLLVAVGVIAAPSAAQAHHSYSTRCATGRVESLAINLPIYFTSSVDSGVILGTARRSIYVYAGLPYYQ
jgi:hypothetical protein